MKTKKLSWMGLAMIGCVTLLSSCKVPKDVAYFQDMDQQIAIEVQERQAIKIRPDDKLQIIVTSKDPQLASLFNLPVVTTRIGQNANAYGTTTAFGTTNNSSEGLSSYTVTPQGTIDFPVLGTLHVAGMTRYELAGFIKGEIIGRNLIKDPTVTVEYLNTGVSVLGEVKTPGRFTFNRDEISVLDAIAMAGDLELNGKRENVRVIRKVREAEDLAADAFGAAHAFLMVGGTTSSVQSMILSTCKRGDEIILPRNVHTSHSTLLYA